MFTFSVKVQNPVARSLAGGDAVAGGLVNGPVVSLPALHRGALGVRDQGKLGALFQGTGHLALHPSAKSTTLPAEVQPEMYSASRIGLWISCNRRAGWKYICGYPEPQNPSAARGTKVHKVLEDNKRRGLLPDRTTEEGAIAAEALPYIEGYVYEGPDGPVQLEGHIYVDGRHKWQGFKDLSAPGTILDYKTSSDPFKWGKTAGELLSDPQAILYAQHYYSAHPPDAPTVKLKWLYLKTKKPYGGHPVELEMTREHAAVGFQVLEMFADEMQAAVEAAPTDVAGKHKYVLTLAHDPSRCREYPPLGCPYRAHCTDILPFSDPNSAERNNHMSVLDRLSALTAVVPEPATSIPPDYAAINEAAVNPPEPATIIPPGDAY